MERYHLQKKILLIALCIVSTLQTFADNDGLEGQLLKEEEIFVNGGQSITLNPISIVKEYIQRHAGTIVNYDYVIASFLDGNEEPPKWNVDNEYIFRDDCLIFKRFDTDPNKESYHIFSVTGIKKSKTPRHWDIHCKYKIKNGYDEYFVHILYMIHPISSLIPDELTMYTEESQVIKSQTPITNAYWKSSKESVASIVNYNQSSCKIEGLSAGNSTISLSGIISDFSFSTDCNVTVKSSKKEVHVKKAGTLSNYITEPEKYHIKDLTITGELNGTDLRLLREMAGNNYLGELTEGRLYKLDLSGASIVEGGKKYLDTNNGIRKTSNEFGVGGEHHYGVDKANEIGEYLFACCPKLKTVILPSNISSICNNAFYYCSSLESISLPDGLEKIGEHAFSSCNNLSMVELPNSLTTLGRFAFADDHSLRNINIPVNLTIIDDYTFDGCRSLNSIELPERLNKIGFAAFRECNSFQSVFIPKNVREILSAVFNSCANLKEIIVDSNNECCLDIDGVLYSKTNNLIQYPSGKEGSRYVVPEGTTDLDIGAFMGNNYLVEIELPQSLIRFSGSTFRDCKNLSEITIPKDVKTLWYGEFRGCTGLKKVTSEIKDPTMVRYYPDEEYRESYHALFDNDTYNNATLYVPYGTKQLYQQTREWKKFKNIVEMERSMVTQITLNATNMEITQRQTFQLSAIVSPSDATNKSITWSSSNASIASVDNTGLVSAISVGNAIITCEAQDGSGVKATCNIIIKPAAPCILFADAEVKRICVQEWDTDGDGELSEVEAANVKSLGYTFGLSSITTFDELRYFTGLTTIDEHAFDRCPNLQSITIPPQVTSIRRAAFSACGALTTVDLPEGLTTIEEMSFERCSGLKSITIPSKVTNIGRAAFSVCSSLTTMILPEGLTSIPELCFERCSGLKSINIPASVNSIGNNAFAQCNSLEDIVSDILEPFDIDASVFTNTTYSSARLCVPKGTKSKYRNVLGWKNFKNILEDGLGEAEINVVSIDIVGDGIVGTPHNYAIKLENVGSVDFTGTLYVWIYEDSEPIESYFNSYNGGIPASVAGTLSSEEDFYFNPSGIYYIWLTTDAEGKNILGSKKAFTVTPAATLTVGNYTRVYGDDNPEFKFTADKGGYNGTPEIICHAKVDSPAGTYPIVITQGGVDNDFVNYVNGTLTITKAPLTIMAGTYIKKQGEDNPDFTLTYKGFKNGETEAVLTKKPTVTTSADWNSPVGVYDVIVTGAEAKNYEISYVAGTLTVEKRPKGDLNAKGYTDVTDVVAAINHALGERTLTYDEKEMLDMNDDGELNVGDIILLVKAILEQGNVVNVPVMARGETEDIDLTKYTAMQLTMNVPAGARIRDIRLAGDNNSSHQLMYRQKDAEHYTVVVYSMSNQTFKPVSGCLLEVDMEGEGEPTTANVLLATPAGERTFISSLPIGTVTGISIVGADQIAIGSVYDLRGNKVLDRGASMKRLPKGVYIMNGKKIIR